MCTYVGWGRVCVFVLYVSGLVCVCVLEMYGLCVCYMCLD